MNEAVGRKKINEIIVELKTLVDLTNLNIMDSLIIDISDVIKEEYSKNLDEFKVLTSSIGMLFNGELYETYTGKVESAIVIIFNDESINTLPQTNIRELLELYGQDLNEFENLAKCKFYINKIYKKEQISQIPGLRIRVKFPKNY